MNALIVFAAILAAAAATPLLRLDTPAIVSGGRSIIAGPSGTIDAHTGTIARNVPLVAPVVHKTILAPTVHSTVLHHSLPLATPILRHSVLDYGLHTPYLF